MVITTLNHSLNLVATYLRGVKRHRNYVRLPPLLTAWFSFRFISPLAITRVGLCRVATALAATPCFPHSFLIFYHFTLICTPIPVFIFCHNSQPSTPDRVDCCELAEDESKYSQRYDCTVLMMIQRVKSSSNIVLQLMLMLLCYVLEKALQLISTRHYKLQGGESFWCTHASKWTQEPEEWNGTQKNSNGTERIATVLGFVSR